MSLRPFKVGDKILIEDESACDGETGVIDKIDNGVIYICLDDQPNVFWPVETKYASVDLVLLPNKPIPPEPIKAPSPIEQGLKALVAWADDRSGFILEAQGYILQEEIKAHGRLTDSHDLCSKDPIQGLWVWEGNALIERIEGDVVDVIYSLESWRKLTDEELQRFFNNQKLWS